LRESRGVNVEVVVALNDLYDHFLYYSEQGPNATNWFNIRKQYVYLYFNLQCERRIT
jgi:hypothetical protein